MTSRCAKSAAVVLLCLELALPVRPALAQGPAGPAAGPATAAEADRAPGVTARPDGAARWRPVLAASAFLLGSAAVVLEAESDREYSRYLETADPRRMREHYDASERSRNLATAAMAGAELCAVGLVVTYLVRKRPPEPEPGSVIISLYACPSGVGLRVWW